MKIEILEPHGMCGGAKAAIEMARSSGGAYCLHHVVHSEIVARELEALGCRFVEDIEEVPDGATVVFSAHGVSPDIRRRAKEKRLAIIDASCPSVERAHRAAREFSAAGLPVVIIGEPGHAEYEGIAGEIANAKPPRPGDRIGVVVQTSMDADAALARVEEMRREFTVAGVSPVCRATAERQNAVRRFKGDALLVLGDKTSANSRRLRDISKCPAFMASDMNEVAAIVKELSHFETVGVTSGASTPENFFIDAVELLKRECYVSC